MKGKFSHALANFETCISTQCDRKKPHKKKNVLMQFGIEQVHLCKVAVMAKV